MRHSFWDHYSDLDSPVHRITSGRKMAAVIFMVLFLNMVPEYQAAFFSIPMIVFLIGVMAVSGVPVLSIVKRTLVIFPLIAPVIILNSLFSDSGFNRSLILAVRSFISVFALVLLVSVTRFADILKTMSRWHFPGILVMILSFMYRYFFLLNGEMEKMVRAIRMRSAGISGARVFRVYGQVLAILFIKSYERAERVYHAMLMRGYDGNGGVQ